MKFSRLTSTGNAGFADAIALYNISFPSHELRESASQLRIMAHPEYHFDLIYDAGQWCGNILYWETAEFIYIEHFCIRPELRGQHIGQRALALLGTRGKTVILEIDPPIDDISRRRREFYIRCGYCENPFSHVHPPYHKGLDGHNLVIMSYPRALSDSEYARFSEYLQTVVMGQ